MGSDIGLDHDLEPLVDVLPQIASNGHQRLAGKLAVLRVAACPECDLAVFDLRPKPGMTLTGAEYRAVRKAAEEMALN